MERPSIVLAAIQARYSHAGLGARFLLANMGELRSRTVFLEFPLSESPDTILAHIEAHRPAIIGLGVYIWNRSRIETLVPALRAKLPEAKIVLGGPEITFDAESDLARSAECVIRGEAELLWPAVCRAWIEGRPFPRLPEAQRPALNRVTLPVDEYTDEDLRHKNVYMEASRGCPFACDFCLSAVESGVRFFPESAVHAAVQKLLDRGCRRFRFVDRSFNTGGARAVALLDFFLARLRPGLRLHFEMTPDGLGPTLRDRLRRFPPGALHIEAGVQSFDPDVLERVHRHGHPDAVAEGIAWLIDVARADVHADLIAGLPGETLAGFAAGFDRLFRLGPAEIQVGVLKRLHGAPIIRHAEPFAMRFRPEPPYDVLQTADMTAGELQDVRRFAAHWERVVGRSHFPRAIARMLDGADSPWARFDAFSRRLAAGHGIYGIGMVEMAAAILDFMSSACGLPAAEARRLLREDYLAGGRRMTVPRFLRDTSGGRAAGTNRLR